MLGKQSFIVLSGFDISPLNFTIITIFFYHIRITVFGDQLNAVNISGIIVIFMGVFLYKVTLHLNHMKSENSSADSQIVGAEFTHVHGDDDYDNEPPSPNRMLKRQQKSSDPDLVLKFIIADDDSEEDIVRDTEESPRLRGRSSPNTSNGNLEIDDREDSDLVIV